MTATDAADTFVWVATNLTTEEAYRLIRADDLRHLRLFEAPRRLMARVPGEPDGWMTIVDGGPAPSALRFSGVVDRPENRPFLPAHFHLHLAAALETARIRAAADRQLLVVQAAHDGTAWQWHIDPCGAALARIDARARIETTVRETIAAP